MVKHAALAFAVIALTATSAAAQGRGKGNNGKVPPGHMPPAGLCKVWYDGVPPGRQPRGSMNCREAERIAARDGARVVYGDGRATRGQREQRGGGGVLDRDGDGRIDLPGRYPGDGRYPEDRGRTDRRRPTDQSTEPRGRAIPRPGTSTRLGAGLGSIAAENGYRDGLVKGREDLEDGDSFDPNRHSWYRSADRGYTSRDGARDTYRDEYRRGFIRGYDAAYVTGGRTRTRR
ncbi:MAG TPA: hypothetical protein VFZ36_06245 [Vicinamibacterales bacterium]